MRPIQTLSYFRDCENVPEISHQLHSRVSREGISLSSSIHEPRTSEPLRAGHPCQLKSKVVTNRISQFFAVDSERVEGKDPLVFRFLGERIPHVGRTETERKPFQYRVTLRYVERTQQNPYGLVVISVEQNETPTESFPNPKSK